MTGLPERVGVVGAGTMGSGIAQLGVLAGMDVYLNDPVPEALAKGAGLLRANLAKGAERGRWSADDARAAAGRLREAGSLDELSSCGMVIEAAPERLDVKRELFAHLSDICPDDAILATNTSSIPVTQIAGGAARPENVVGLHFFNPAPLMKLVEVIRAVQTGERAVATATAVGEAMGKRVILAADGPGFLVNRCGRPFYSEALRVVQERIATPEQVDRICRLAGGFRMGPFELMDLVGIDVGFEVAKSFMELSFGEPRWKPNPLQARMAASGRHGRKTGRGWYDYSRDPYRDPDPEPLEPGGGDGRVVAIWGESDLTDELRGRAAAAGFEVLEHPEDGSPVLVVDASRNADAEPDRELGEFDAPLVSDCFDDSLTRHYEAYGCGFSLLPPAAGPQLVELTRMPATPDDAAALAEDFFRCCGYHHEWVGDGPGLVLGRILCQLVNEAAFAIGEGVGSAADVDDGLKLGLNHPHGPAEWGAMIGLRQVSCSLERLWEYYREERYRAAPHLHRAAILGSRLG